MLLEEIGFDKAIELHRSMWHWLENEYREGRLSTKLDYFDTDEYKSLNIENDLNPNSECFCCEYTVNLQLFMEKRDYKEGLYYDACSYCPIKWNDVDWTPPTPGICPCIGGYYRKYCVIENDARMEDDERCDKLSAIAKIIAERPVREKTKYDIAYDQALLDNKILKLLNLTMEDITYDDANI